MGDTDPTTAEVSSRDEAADDERTQQLRAISDSILAAMTAVRAMEAEKRTVPMGSPRFDELAKEIEHASRAVFDLAGQERSLGEEIPVSEARATVDIPPE